MKIFVLAILLILILYSSYSFAQITDSLSHPPPATGTYAYSPPGTWTPTDPSFIGLGQSYVDPVFGSTIMRMTNEYPITSGSTIYVKNGWWNADGTLFLHERRTAPTSAVFVIINVSDGAFVRYNTPQGSRHGDVSFDPVNPDIYYYWNGAQLRQYSVSTNNNSLVKTFPATIQGLGGSVDWIDASGRYFLAIYNSSIHVWDKQLDIIYNSNISSVVGTGFVGISPDSNYIVISGPPGAWGLHYSYKVDHATKTLNGTGTMFWSLCGDHGDLVSASDGKNYFVTLECYNQAAIYRVDITIPQTHQSTGGVAAVAKQWADNKMLINTDWPDAGHISCASKPPNQDWCFYSVSSSDDTFTNQGTWRPYKQEILRMQVVPPYTVERLAHHRSRSTSANYYYHPRISGSWDGTRAAWTSNYGYNGTSGYDDVYTIDIGGTPPPPITCSDGTAQNQCSLTKSLQCNSQLQLVSNCGVCGCSTGQQCNATSQACYTPTAPQTCSDGTTINTCSSTQPQYCNSQLQLVDSCSTNLCGCPSGQQCNTTSSACYTQGFSGLILNGRITRTTSGTPCASCTIDITLAGQTGSATTTAAGDFSIVLTNPVAAGQYIADISVNDGVMQQAFKRRVTV